MIKYVAQLEPGGCLVACVAMVTGRTYAEIREMCVDSYKDGIHEFIADNIIYDLGFAIVRRYKHRPRLKRDCDVWPCEPFAPAHFCIVHATQGPHAVVLNELGIVLDPWDPSRISLANPVYTQIDSVCGVFPVHQ